MLERTQTYFFFGLFAVIGVVAFAMALPFLQALVLAAAFAVVFSPFYRWLTRALGNSPRIAAVATIIVVTLIIIAPLAALGTQVVTEAQDLYARLGRGLGDVSFDGLVKNIFGRLPGGEDLNPDESIRKGLSWVVGSVGGIFAGTLTFFLNLFIWLLALYYFLLEGHIFKKWIVSFSPLPDQYDTTILEHLAITVNSVIRGSLVVALAQGLIAGIGFALFSVPNPALWGTLTAIASLIPGIGTALVVAPAVIYLFLAGDTGQALGLLLWGAIAVGLIDNVLRPMLIKSGVRVHPLAIFISVLGGLVVFGPLGFLIGPLVFSIFFTMLDIYGRLRKGERPEIPKKSA